MKYVSDACALGSSESEESDEDDDDDNAYDDGDEVIDSESEREATQTSGSRSTVSGTRCRSIAARSAQTGSGGMPPGQEGGVKRSRTIVEEEGRVGNFRSTDLTATRVEEDGSEAQDEGGEAGDDDDILCAVCRGADEKGFLLCDGMGPTHGVHMHCLTPKLKSVPIGKWFCDTCKKDEHQEVIPPRNKLLKKNVPYSRAGKENVNVGMDTIKEIGKGVHSPALEVSVERKVNGGNAQRAKNSNYDGTVALRPVSIPHIGGIIGGRGRYRMGLSRSAALPRLHNGNPSL